MKVIFMGTPDFAVPSLLKLVEDKNFTVEAVFTQPDKPKGRGKKLSMSAVKEAALKNNLKIFQPKSLRKEEEYVCKIKEMAPDFIVIVAFGQIIKQNIIDIPKYGCINLHASLLPELRGAAPINWAIINGLKVTGNTTMMIDEGIDTGDMLLSEEVQITDDMTAGDLQDKLMYSGADLLIKTLYGLKEGTVQRKKQDDKFTYAPLIKKETCRIDWNKEPICIRNLVRGLSPNIGAYTYYNEELMKIWDGEVSDEKTDHDPGYIIDASCDGIKVSAKNGVFIIKKLQFPGGKQLNVSDYLRGHKIEKGITLT